MNSKMHTVDYPASVRFSEFHWSKDITWRQDKSHILPPRVRLRKKEDIAFYRTLLTSEKNKFDYERILGVPAVQDIKEPLKFDFHFSGVFMDCGILF